MSDDLILGRDVHTKDPVGLSDAQRTDGLLIIGKSGMGKSTLLLRAILHDIAAGHGLFFLDPHGDTVTELTKCGDRERLERDFLLLDPAKEDCSFGINLTRCEAVTSLASRVSAYTRSYNVLRHTFADQWSTELQLIIQNILPVFIENQTYTLSEVPQFLSDGKFRAALVASLRYHPEVTHFWGHQFEAFRGKAPGALSHLLAFFTNPYVRDIVGQSQTSVDFAKYLTHKKIVCVRLPGTLERSVRRFAGTLLTNELHAALANRREPSQVSVVIDEFQDFVGPDLLSDITSGQQSGVLVTLSQRELPNQSDPLHFGAQSFPFHLVCFRLAARDAKVLAPLFTPGQAAAEGTQDTLVFSDHAVEDIWDKGHPDPGVMYARNKYFWIVELLRQHPNETYFLFDPAREALKYYWPGIPADLSSLPNFEHYRSSAMMVKEAIVLLNTYYSHLMTGAKSEFLTKADVFLMEHVIARLGGLYGFRKLLRPVLPPASRERLAHLYRQYYARERDGKIDRAQAALQKAAREGRKDEARALEAAITELRGTRAPELSFPEPVAYEEWRDKARAWGLSLQASEALFRWELPETIGNIDREDWYMIYLSEKEQDWQHKEVMDFITHCFDHMREVLPTQPVRRPKMKTWKDYVEAMARELTNLPAFTAYVKLAPDTGGQPAIYKLQTLPPPPPQKTGFLMPEDSDYCIPRAQIHEEIRRRLSPPDRDKDPDGFGPAPLRRG